MEKPALKTRLNLFRFGLLLLVLATFAALVIRPEIMAPLGVGLPSGRWFIDIYALLASSEAFAIGLDPYQPNPLDWLHVPHWYSDWWFYLHDFGLNRTDTPWMGCAIAVGYLVAALLLIRPRDISEMLTAWLIISSPVMMLGVNRANPDLLIFSAFTLLVWLLSNQRRPLWLLGGPLIAFMAGLKFYPLAGALALLFAPRIHKEVKASLLLMAVLTLLLGLGLHDDVLRVAPLIDTPAGFYTFGGAGIFVLMGFSSSIAFVFTAVTGIVLTGLWWIRTPDLPVALANREVVSFVVGAATLVGCFFVGVGYSYRLVFVVLLLPLFGSLRLASTNKILRRKVYLGLVGAIFLVWFDGVICLGSNLVWHSSAPDWAPLLWKSSFVFSGLISWLWIGVIMSFLVALFKGAVVRLSDERRQDVPRDLSVMT